MEELNKDVNAPETSAGETDVKVTADTSTQETTQAEQTTPEPSPQVADVDETGVPWKNRAMEWKRKSDEVIEGLPLMIEEAVKRAVPQGQQQREYTVSELEAFASQNPEYRPWVEEQKQQIMLKKLTAEMDTKIKSADKARNDEITRQQSVQYVMQTFPEAFVKDNSGKIVNWDNNHPITQQIGILMRDPRFATDPQGLVAASEIAYARYVRGQQPRVNQEQQRLKAEVGDLQRKTMVEGGGKTPIQTRPSHRVAVDKAKQSGNLNDVASAIGEILKIRRGQEE